MNDIYHYCLEKKSGDVGVMAVNLKYPVVMDIICIGSWLAANLYSLLIICRDCNIMGNQGNGADYSNSIDEAGLKAFCRSYGLTGREEEIVKAIYEGKRITQIATDLGLSENTVRVHSSRLYKKLDVEDRVQAANKIREEFKRGKNE